MMIDINIIGGTVLKIKVKKFDKLLLLILYTIIYIIMCYAVWGYFKLSGKSFVNMTDAFEQHIKSLIEYGKYIRGYFYHVIHDHSLIPQNYSFGIGYGADFYSSMQYYCIGDILNLSVAFMPSEAVYNYYNFLILLRPYLAGLSLYAFASYKKSLRTDSSANDNYLINIPAFLTGMISYAFCGTVMFIGMWNPFFVNPMIYLPLMLLGAEIFMHDKKPFVFIISVFLAACSNFYFFYMLVVLTIGYCIIRLIAINANVSKKVSDIFKAILEFLILGIIGTMMSLVVLLPVVLMFLNNPRMGSGHSYTLLYQADYYKELLQNLISYIYHPQYDTELGYTFIAIPVIICLFMNFKKYKEELIMFIIMIIMLIFPVFGYAMTGFAYMINRWTFAASLLICMLIIELWNEFYKMSKIKCIILIITTVIIIALYYLTHVSDTALVSKQLQLLIAVTLIMVVASLIGDRIKFISHIAMPVAALILVAAGISYNGYYANSADEGNLPNGYVDSCTGAEFLALQNDSEVKIIEQVAGDSADSFYRYTGRNLTWNASLLDGISSTQFYWSLTNGNISNYLSELAINEMADFSYYGLDDRTIPLTLSGVKYYSLRYDNDFERLFVPYGFSYNQSVYNFAEFENINAMSLGYTYANTISSDEYEAMTPAQRQEAMLQGVVINDGKLTGEYNEISPAYTYSSLEYNMTLDDNIKDKGSNTYKVKKDGGTITFTFDGLTGCETYLYIKGLEYNGQNDAVNITVNAYSKEEAKTTKTIAYKTPESQFYSGWHDYMVNMGYSDGSITSITVTLPDKGTVSYEDIEIICQPMDNLNSQIAELSKYSLTNIELCKNPISKMTNTITADITNDEDRILVLNIPYQGGWTAYVDGVKTDVVRANTMFMAIDLPKGEHMITLKYNTPGLLPGLILSIIGILLLIAATIYYKRQEK